MAGSLTNPALFDEAAALFNAGDYKAALAKLRRLRPDEAAGLAEARCLESLGRREEAERRLRALAAKGSARACAALAAALRRRGEDAAAWWRRALKADPTLAEARAGLAEAEQLARVRAEAAARARLEARERARRDKEARARARRAPAAPRGETLPAVRAPAAVAPAIAPGLGLSQLLERAAEVELQSGRAEQARAIWTQAALSLDAARSAEELRALYRLRVALREYPAAFEAAEKLLALDASDENSIAALASPWAVTAAFHVDRAAAYREDREALESLARAGGYGPWPHYLLGLLTADAAALERAVPELRPRHAWMRLELARTRLVRERFTDAREAALAAAGWTGLCYAAEASLCLGETDRALAEYDAAAALSGRFLADALAWKAEGLLWLGRYAEAERVLDEAVAGEAPYALCWRGAAKLKRGRAREALRDLERGLALYDRDLESYAWRAEALLALDRPEEAVAAASVEPLRARSGGTLSLPQAAGPLDRSWHWHLTLRALAWGRLGREQALRADYARLNTRLLRSVGAPEADAPVRDLLVALESMLDRARGCRRPESYVDSIWAK